MSLLDIATFVFYNIDDDDHDDDGDKADKQHTVRAFAPLKFKWKREKLHKFI